MLTLHPEYADTIARALDTNKRQASDSVSSVTSLVYPIGVISLQIRWIALACVLASSAAAQVTDYNGPGVLSEGAGTIGVRSGGSVDLRLFADVTGIYDTGLAPYAFNSKGDVVPINGLYGEEVDFGVYGTHFWRQSTLSLNYSGSFYNFANDSAFDGSTQNLAVGYTYQKSRHVTFDLRQIAGTASIATGGADVNGFGYIPLPGDVVNQPTTLLFDTRTYYVQSTADMNYIQSARTIYTIGGDGFWVRYDAAGLPGLNGYDLHGRIQHRLSKTRTVGAIYSFTHFEFPPIYGQTDMHTVEGFFSLALNRRWTVSITAGIVQTEVQGIQSVPLSPTVAALLGQPFANQAFYSADVFPSGIASLSGTFRRSALQFDYSRTVLPGNGFYLTSRVATADGSYSYTGIHKWNLGASVSYNSMSSIGQGLAPFSMIDGGGGFTYSISRLFHAVGRYDYRHLQVPIAGFPTNSYRVTLGLAFSPGNIPLSLW